MVTGGITNNGTITGARMQFLSPAPALLAASQHRHDQRRGGAGRHILNLNGTAGSISGAVTGGVGSVVNVNGTFTTADTFAWTHSTSPARVA